ncbi:MAG: toprim domain-containing protein [Methylovulum sp.]|nr:toprim domain-containing protein [Methylovulum sp.]
MPAPFWPDVAKLARTSSSSTFWHKKNPDILNNGGAFFFGRWGIIRRQLIIPIAKGKCTAILEIFQMAVEEFIDAIRAAGLVPPDIITKGKIIPFAGLDKPKTNKAARCFLFPDGRGGWFMDYSTGLFEVWQAKRGREYTEAERQAFREQCERDRLARKQAVSQGRQQATAKAHKIWKRAIYADAGNLYLHRKQVQPHGTKTGDSGSLECVLIIPLFDETLVLVNLQFIQADGTKRFLTGGQKRGCFWWLGKKTPTVLICEGFATAASLYQHTGNQTFIAFDAGNLANVAKTVRAKNPDAEIIIMGDHDDSGTGQRYARAAALACGGKYLIPPTVGHDWNDHLIKCNPSPCDSAIPAIQRDENRRTAGIAEVVR